MIPGKYKRVRRNKNTGVDKVRLKCDCTNGSIVNGVREPVLQSLALSSPPGLILYKEPRIRLFKKLEKSVLSHINFYFEDDDHRPVDFKNETKSFTCQLNKK